MVVAISSKVTATEVGVVQEVALVVVVVVFETEVVVVAEVVVVPAEPLVKVLGQEVPVGVL